MKLKLAVFCILFVALGLPAYSAGKRHGCVKPSSKFAHKATTSKERNQRKRHNNRKDAYKNEQKGRKKKAERQVREREYFEIPPFIPKVVRLFRRVPGVLDRMGQFSVASWNVFGLRVPLPSHLIDTLPADTRRLEFKSKEQLKYMAKTIQENNIDFLTLVETGEQIHIENFVSRYLDDQFAVLMLESPNDVQRVTHIAFLVRKTLPVHLSLESSLHHFVRDHRNRVYAMFRDHDLPILKIWSKEDSIADDDPKMIIVGGHFSNALGERPDSLKVIIRSDQLVATEKILQDLQQKYPNALVILNGDMNAHLSKARHDFNFMRAIGFTDTFDDRSLDEFDRGTFLYTDGITHGVVNQLDGIFTNDSRHLVDSRVLPLYSNDGSVLPVFGNSRDRRNIGVSDHNPVYAEFYPTVFSGNPPN